MSHELAQVRFDADGLILHGEYNATVDTMQSALRDSVSEVRAHWREENHAECTCGQSEAASVAVSCGICWPATACRRCRALTSDRSPIYHVGEEEKPVEWTLPPWWKDDTAQL